MQRRSGIITERRNLARISRICLECAAIFLHLALTVRCRLWNYTRAMIIKRILTICAAVTDGAAAGMYSDCPGGPPQTYSDRGNGDNRIPGSGFIYPNDDDNRAPRPPEAVGAPGGVTGSVQQPPMGPDGRPMVLSALPPDEQ